jgi:hypothetical protein
MKCYILHLFLLIFTPLFAVGTNVKTDTLDYDTLSLIGKQFIPNTFFKNRFNNNSLEQYLDNYQEFVIYQTETTGDFSQGNLQTFSILGNSHKWNKFYINDFRIDDRFFAGNSLYKFDLYETNILIDLWNSNIEFTNNSNINNSVLTKFNYGGLGGTAPFSANLIHLFHSTGRETMYIDIKNQRKIKNSGEFWFHQNLKFKDKILKQNLYVLYGQKMLVGFNYKGNNDYYPEKYLTINMNGDLPFSLFKILDSMHYLCGISNRDYLFAEYNYSKNEAAKYKNFNASIYGKNQTEKLKLTSGFNFSYKNIEHQNLEFSRNFVDQDGEGFEPWYPNTVLKELSHSLNLTRKFNSNLSFYAETYNSLINVSPKQKNFRNTVYYQLSDTNYRSLYLYEWTSNSFSSTLLENKMGFNYHKESLTKKLKFDLKTDATFDAILLNEKSMFRPNWQTEISLNYSPSKKFSISLNAGKKRVAYNFDQVKFLSNDYLSGNIYYWNDANGDKEFQTNEKSDLFTTTGGKHHFVTQNLKQQGIFYFEIPFKFTFGKHQIFVENLYKKFFNQWQVYPQSEAKNLGFFIQNGENNVFFLNDGEMNYVIEYFDSDFFKNENDNISFLFNSPFYAGNTFKYQYNGNKFFISASWTSYMIVGFGSLGNGVLHNNIDVLSENSSNPNLHNYRIGRLDSDRSFIGRFLFSYKISEKINLSFQFKYKDGQPFAVYNTYFSENGDNTQIAIQNYNTKGDNPFTGDFGRRKDAFFDSVLGLTITGKLFKNNYSTNISIYNIYDFGTELSEYVFSPDLTNDRYTLELNIPRGIMFSFKYSF